LPIDYLSILKPLAAALQTMGVGFAPADGGLLLQAWVSIILCLVVIFALPNTETLLSSYRQAVERGIFRLRGSSSPLWAVAAGVLAFVCVACLNDVNPLQHWRL
jgi:hypothetical protein